MDKTMLRTRRLESEEIVCNAVSLCELLDTKDNSLLMKTHAISKSRKAIGSTDSGMARVATLVEEGMSIWGRLRIDADNAGVLESESQQVERELKTLTRDQEQLLCVSDTALHPIHLEQPDWYAAVDLDPVQVEVTRRRILTKATTEKSLVLAFHFPFPGLGRVVQKGEVWQWQLIEAMH